MNGKVIDAVMLLYAGSERTAAGLTQQQKELDLLWKLNQDVTYETQTDSQEAYQKTVPSGAVAAEIGSIGGKTVVWNNRDNDIANAVVNVTARPYFAKAYHSETGITSITNEESYTGNLQLISNNREFLDQCFPVGHKFLIRAFLKVPFDTLARISAYPNSAPTYSSIPQGIWKALTTITTIESSATEFNLFINTSNFTPGDVVEIKGRIAVDLTQMFGAGNEPANASDPRIVAAISYAEAHPDYDDGSLLNAAVTSVVSKGTDEETLDTLVIPAAVRTLEGYGQSAVGGNGNTLNLSAGTYTEIGHYVDGTWTALDTPVVTDVSGLFAGNLLDTEAGGTLTFASASMLPVPNSVDYLIKLSEVIP